MTNKIIMDPLKAGYKVGYRSNGNFFKKYVIFFVKLKRNILNTYIDQVIFHFYDFLQKK